MLKSSLILIVLLVTSHLGFAKETETVTETSFAISAFRASEAVKEKIAGSCDKPGQLPEPVTVVVLASDDLTSNVLVVQTIPCDNRLHSKVAVAAVVNVPFFVPGTTPDPAKAKVQLVDLPVVQ